MMTTKATEAEAETKVPDAAAEAETSYDLYEGMHVKPIAQGTCR